jgi:hypothetical protein
MPTPTETSKQPAPTNKLPPTTGDSGEMEPSHDLVEYLKMYARERPEVAALWCFGIGFVLGWKLKPW